MYFLSKATIIKHGFVLLLLAIPLSSHAANMTDKDRGFWDELNDYISFSIAQNIGAPDPFEPLNRKVYEFNEFADRIVLKPVAKTYHSITPDPLERGIGNVFSNLLELTTIVNDVLQLKFGQAFSDSTRFTINSTVGIFGLFDVASAIGLEKHNEDFGQTLGFWGVGPGPYIMAPFLGSYSFRDGVGAYADSFTDYVGQLDYVPTRSQLMFTRVIHTRASLLSAEELISGDTYSFLRDAYLQRREYLVSDGAVEDSFGDEVFDEDWDDEWDEEWD